MQSVQFLIARLGLIGLFLAITFVQVLSFPGQFAYMRRTNVISLAYEITLTAVVALWLLCGQLALVCAWQIVTAMQKNTFYTQANMTWVNRLLLCFKSAVVVAVVLFGLIASVADDPGVLVLLSVVTLAILVVTVCLSLLRDQLNLKL